jgi:transcriptional regulator with XRE-family HTH domain
MGNPRCEPRLLPAKLLAIRKFLNVKQADMATKLQSEIPAYPPRRYRIETAHVTKYEKGEREPNLLVLIAYVRLGHIHMESVVDDDVSMDEFRRRLGKEFDYTKSAIKARSNKRVITSKRKGKGESTRVGEPVNELLAHAVQKGRPAEADEFALLTRFRELSARRKADLWNILELWTLRDASKKTSRSSSA